MRGKARGFRLDQAIAAFGRLDPADFLQMLRPRLARDPQELQRVLPVFVELVGHQPVERVPVDAARHHVVHQPRQIAGQRQRRSRAADHQRRRHRAFRPGRDQMRQHQPALQFAEPRRNVERRDTARSDPSEKASSSSSMSPSATMRGRIAASVFSTSRKMSRASRPARRVGR